MIGRDRSARISRDLSQRERHVIMALHHRPLDELPRPSPAVEKIETDTVIIIMKAKHSLGENHR